MTSTRTDSIETATLPPVLSVLAKQLDAATDQISRLKSLLDLYETLLRLAAGLAVGSLRSQLDTAPDELARILVDQLEHPSWSAWQQIAVRCAPLIDPSLGISLSADLARLEELSEELRDCRNEFDHLPSAGWASAKFEAFAPRVADALRSLPWLANVRLEVQVASKQRTFEIGSNLELEGDVSVAEATVVARVQGHAVSLYPFFVAVDDRTTPLLGVFKSLTDSWKKLTVAGLGPLALEPPRTQAQSKHPENGPFRTWCRYSERTQLLGRVQSFDKEVSSAPPIFGRSQELREVVAAIEHNRIVFVEGVAGSGKSHLLRHLVRKLQNDSNVVYWRFDENDAVRSARLPFLKHLAAKLGQHYRPGTFLPRLDIDPSAWETVLKALFAHSGDGSSSYLHDA